MKLIEDLGMLYPTPTSKKPRRFGLYECSKCLKPEKKLTSMVKQRNLKVCANCAINFHGLKQHLLYKVWTNIKTRCYNKNSKDYATYGAVGVTLHDEWLNDFKAFYDWCMANGWKQGLHCDKDTLSKELGIQPHIYSRNTIMFINPEDNAAVKSPNKHFKGVKTKGSRFHACINYRKVRYHIGTYDTKEEAAIAYNEYIEANNLPHIKNIVD